MKLTFLGTSAGTPTRARNVSSVAMQLPQRSALWLFDCGEGTQHQILRTPLRLSQLERIFFTHLHGDHLFGLVGLLATRSPQSAEHTPVTLCGPAGLEEFVRVSLRVSQTQLTYPVHFEVVTPQWSYEDETMCVTCRPLAHRIPAFGYAIHEKDQAGRFDVERAQALGIPPGPLYGKLKNGETVTLPDGRTIHGAELVGPTKRGRKVVICGDTFYTKNAVELAQAADLLVHEATYLEEDRELAERAQHATATMAARVAREANANTLVLTHFSPRYEAGPNSRLPELLTEAQAVFPNTLLARDLWSYEVARPALILPSTA